MSIRITKPGRLQQATAGRPSADRSPELIAQGLQSFAQGARTAAEASSRIQQNVSNAYVAREEPRIALEMERRLEELRLGIDGKDPGAFTATVAEEMAAKYQTELDAAPELARGQLADRMRRLDARIQSQALRIEAAAAVEYLNQSFAEASDLQANRLLVNPDLFDEVAGDMGEDIGALDQPENFKRELAYQSVRKLAYGTLSGRIMQPSMQDEDGTFVTGPERALFELTQTERWDNKLTDDEKRSLINAAQSEIAARARAAKSEDEANKKLLRDKIKDRIEAGMLGRDDAFLPDDQSLIAAAEALDDPVVSSDVNEFLELQSLTAGFRSLGLPGMYERRDAMLASVNQSPNTTEMQRRFLKGMDQIITETEEMGRRDPIGGLVSAGLIRQRPDVTFDFSDPDNPIGPTAEQWTALARAGYQAEEYYNRADIGVLAPAQATQLARALRQAPPDAAAAQLAVMAQNLPDAMVKGVAAQLWAENEETMATAVALAPESPRVSEQIIRGRRIMDSEQYALTDNQIRAAIPDAYYNLFTNHPALYEALIPAATAYYSANTDAANLQSGAAINSEDFRDALDAVSGGLVRMNGEDTIVPRRGMTQGDFDALLTNYVGQQFSADGFTFNRYGHVALPDGSLSMMGDGGLPAGVGGVITSQKFLDHATLRPHSDGVYYIMMGGRPLLGANSQPFLLNVGAMFDDYGSTRTLQVAARPSSPPPLSTPRGATRRDATGERARPGGRVETSADL